MDQRDQLGRESMAATLRGSKRSVPSRTAAGPDVPAPGARLALIFRSEPVTGVKRARSIGCLTMPRQWTFKERQEVRARTPR